VKRKIEAGYSVETAVHIRNAISAVFNHAKLKRAYAGDNPAQGVRMPEMNRKEAHALGFQMGRELLLLLPDKVRTMALMSMTTSLNVAEILALRWKRVNLTGEMVIVGAEVLQPCSLAVRENYYRGKFGSVKAKSHRRVVPLSRTVMSALLELRAESKWTGPEDLDVFSNRIFTKVSSFEGRPHYTARVEMPRRFLMTADRSIKYPHRIHYGRLSAISTESLKSGFLPSCRYRLLA
jgi:integrase